MQVLIVQLLQAGFVAFIAATLFLRTHLHPNSIAEGQLYSGFLFFTLLQMFFSGIAEMTFAVCQRCISSKSFQNAWGKVKLSTVAMHDVACHVVSPPTALPLYQAQVCATHVKSSIPSDREASCFW